VRSRRQHGAQIAFACKWLLRAAHINGVIPFLTQTKNELKGRAPAVSEQNLSVAQCFPVQVCKIRNGPVALIAYKSS
jgi:hypothetical protein